MALVYRVCKQRDVGTYGRFSGESKGLAVRGSLSVSILHVNLGRISQLNTLQTPQIGGRHTLYILKFGVQTLKVPVASSFAELARAWDEVMMTLLLL